MKGPKAFRRTGLGKWTYLGFQVRRCKGAQFSNRIQTYRTDAALDDEAITLSAHSLAELKWEIDCLIGEGGVPSDPGMAEYCRN